MHPVLFNVFGFFNLHTYGLMIALGFMIGMQLGTREARRVDLSDEGGYDQFILDLTFWILIVAMVGARLMFITVEWESDYARQPLKIFKIWEGGLVFYGGLIASILFSIFYSIHHKRDFFLVSDTLIPSVALGQFFGRIGCFAAGCCWGDAVSADFPFAVQFPPDSLAYNTMQRTGVIGFDAPATIHVHPVQMYESFGALVIFFILVFVRTRKRFHGQVLLTYLFLYPIMRSSLELLRGDKARGEYDFLGTTISTAQIVSVILGIVAAVTLAALLGRRKKLSTA
jgi:phosphatidylglycerol:prolipoprotein diacylglycerol transferase